MRKSLFAISGLTFLLVVLVGCCSFSTTTSESSGTTTSTNAGQENPPEVHVNYEEQTISPEVEQCTPQWDCSSWTTCGRTGLQERTCADANTCGSEVGKPSETQSCTPTDQCSHVAERGSTLLSTCYQQKYNEPAKETNNVSLCNDIVSPQYMGSCYASFALDKKDGSVCDVVLPMPYTATGYYDNVTSREVCYYYYVLWMEQNHLSFEGQYCEGVENIQMKEECNELDEKYYSKPASMELSGAAKEGDILTIQLKFNRASGWTSSHFSEFSELDFDETNLDGELTYRINRMLDASYTNWMTSDGTSVCTQCAEDFSTTLFTRTMALERIEFNRYSVSGGSTLLYSFQIPLEGLDIRETLSCTGTSVQDGLECSMSCPSGDQSCVDDCLDEHRHTEQCKMQYSVAVEVEGEDGSNFEDEKVASQILE